VAPVLSHHPSMKRSLLTLGSVAALVFAPRQSHAQPRGILSYCDFCLCSQSSSPLEWSGSGIRYDVRYTDLSKMYENGQRVTNSDNERETYLTNQFTLNYAPSATYSLTIIAPYATKSASGASEHITNSGIADVTLLGRYNLLAGVSDECSNATADSGCCDQTIRYASIIGGAKLATGSTSFREPGNGELADADLQLGTGTTDALIGAAYLVTTGEWTLSTNALASIPAFGGGANGHKYGNNLNYDVTARYRLFTKSLNGGVIPTTLVGASLRGEWRAKESEDGELEANSGGNVLYVAPNLQLFFTRNLAFDAACWIPVSHNLTGAQLGEAVKILAGVQAGL
jgi:hypothetical protein